MTLDALKRHGHIGFRGLLEIPVCSRRMERLDGPYECRAVPRVLRVS
jgi:hypothetical protein